MNPGLIIIPFAALLAGEFAKSSKDAADKLTYSFQGGVHFSFKGINRIGISFKVGIKNPTKQSLWFDRLDASGSWNNYTIGTATIKNRILIHADQTTIFEIPFLINSQDVFQAVLAAIKEKSFGTAKISGVITSGAIKIPVEQTFNQKK